ncbi:MAG: L-serine ammonia-lyase, iron-sulfur-dependent, subunit alpha, partial [Clostridiaceae bacterium]
MFKNVAELVAQAQEKNKKIYEIMVEQEIEETGKSQEEVYALMSRHYYVMKNATEKGIKGVRSHSGMTGGDARRMYDYIQKGSFITDKTLLTAACYAVATNEVNAAMGVVCATPTAGSSGVLPGVLLAAKEKFHLSDDEVIKYLFTAGAFGYIIANNAFISGAAGGCQAEIGSASAMAAAAVAEMAGGTPVQAAHAMAMALKNMLGLACDPLAGLVEVP